MKKRSKILAVLLAATMTAGLVSACGGKKAEEPAPAPAAQEEAPPLRAKVW